MFTSPTPAEVASALIPVSVFFASLYVSLDTGWGRDGEALTSFYLGYLMFASGAIVEVAGVAEGFTGVYLSPQPLLAHSMMYLGVVCAVAPQIHYLVDRSPTVTVRRGPEIATGLWSVSVGYVVLVFAPVYYPDVATPNGLYDVASAFAVLGPIYIAFLLVYLSRNSRIGPRSGRGL